MHKKQAPANLIICSKLSHKEKMEIFNKRVTRLLRFLLTENYTSLENVGLLLNVPKQTALRITKHLTEKQYVTKLEVDIGLARPISVFQPTNTGVMFAIQDNEELPELRDATRINPATIYHDLKLQQIRFILEAQGYHSFMSAWHISRLLKKDNKKVPKIPDYTCTNPQGDKVAVEYERTIKSKKRYQEVIEQYMEIQKRGVIKQVIYFTNEGFAEKLRLLFTSINEINRINSIAKTTSNNSIDFFTFLNY